MSVHRGPRTSFAKSGSTALVGDVTVTQSGAIVITQSGQNLDIATSITSSTDNRIVRFDGTAGAIQSSSLSIQDDGDLDYVGSGTFSIANTVSSTAAVNIGPRLELNSSYTFSTNEYAISATPNISYGSAGGVIGANFAPTLTQTANNSAFVSNVGTTYQTTFDTGSTTGGAVTAYQGLAANLGKSGTGNLSGEFSACVMQAINSAACTITTAYGGAFTAGTTGSAVITNAISCFTRAAGPIFGGTVTTATSLLVGMSTAGGTNYGVRQTTNGTNSFDGSIIITTGGLGVTGNWGFNGVSRTATQTGYTTFTNLTTDRTCDADATSVAELADILGTLIVDLKTKGILSA